MAAIFLNGSEFFFQMKVVAGNKTNTTVFGFFKSDYFSLSYGVPKFIN